MSCNIYHYIVYFLSLRRSWGHHHSLSDQMHDLVVKTSAQQLSGGGGLNSLWNKLKSLKLGCLPEVCLAPGMGVSQRRIDSSSV